MPSTRSHVTTVPLPGLDVSRPVIDLWRQQLFDTTTSMTRLQLAWMQSMSDAMQHEAEFFMACAAVSEKMTRCFTEPQSLDNPEKLGECYNELVKDMTEAQLERLRKVADLPQEFRARLWEEL